MDSTFGSSPSRLKTDDSLLQTDYTTKGNSIGIFILILRND